jgi:hypothetical protein
VSIDENALDESQGFGQPAGSAAADYVSVIRCPSESGKPLLAAPLLAGPLDWDCDGTTGGISNVDLNADGKLSAFSPFLEWPRLVFDGGALGAGPPFDPFEMTETIEPQVEELLANQKALEEAVARHKAKPTPPGPGPARPASPGPDVTAPTFSGPIRAQPKRFARRKKTTLVYTISEDASVVVTVARLEPGRKVGRGCRKQTAGNRRKPRCTRRVGAGSFAHAARAGENRVPFTGRRGARKLKPGTYALTLVATDASGNRSAPRVVKVKVR